MRRHTFLTVATTALVSVGGVAHYFPVSAADSAVLGDRTEPYGQFGFTTQGLAQQGGYGEPSLAIAPDGKHVAVSTPGGGGVNVWHSADDGRTWGKTVTKHGGGDSELDFLPDGTLLSADLTVGGGAAELDSWIRRSTDFGATWDDGRAAGMEQDRQWFAHTPDGKRQFLVYHDLAVEGEFISQSTDGGKTWTTAPQDQIRVNDPGQVAPPAMAGAKPGDPASLLDEGVNTYSGPMLVDPKGKDFYVVYSISNFESNANPTVGVPPFGPVHGIVLAHSADAGSTWTNRYAVVAPSNPSDPSHEQQTGTMFPWGFLDPAGTIYIVYDSNAGAEGTDHFGFAYVYSKDKGATWSKPVKLDGLAPGQGAVVFNTGAAVAPGVIDVAWLQKDTSGLSADEGAWYPWFAQITGADTGQPVVSRQKMTTVPNHKGGVCIQGILCGVAPGSSDRSLADFFELAVNPRTGMAEVAYSDNARLGPDAKGKPRGQVVFAKQTIQPRQRPGRSGDAHGPGADPQLEPAEQARRRSTS